MKRALLALILAATPLWGAEQRFAFAVPETEGRITLGVFNAGGKRVRTLFAAAEKEDFAVGLNGLLASWDGRDDAGAALPAGTYHIRGWLVADSVQAEGVAYHFNDWIADDTSPRMSGIGAVVPGGENEPLLIFGFRPGQTSAGEALWTFHEEGGLKLLADLPAKARFLTGVKGGALMGDPAKPEARVFPDPAPFGPFPGAFAAAAVWRDKIFLRPDDEGTAFTVIDPVSGQGESTPAPAAGLDLDANDAALFAWNRDAVWERREGAFGPVPLETRPEAFHLSAGAGDTFWIAGRLDAEGVVRQHALTGEMLREMKIQESFADQVHVFAAKSAACFYLLLQSPHWSRQTLRGYRPMHPAEVPAGTEPVTADWEVFLDKTIENCRRFGLQEGRLVADAGTDPQPDRVKIALPADALTGKSGSVVLTADTRPDGLWLVTADGLPLLPLSESAAFERFVMEKGGSPGSLKLYAGDGTVVAEYQISGLTELTALDVGAMELP